MSLNLPNDPILKALVQKIEEDIEDLTKDVAKGSCKDFAEYKKKCGALDGLDIALGHLENLAREYLLEEDGGF